MLLFYPKRYVLLASFAGYVNAAKHSTLLAVIALVVGQLVFFYIIKRDSGEKSGKVEKDKTNSRKKE
jgi:hypothetical protein